LTEPCPLGGDNAEDKTLPSDNAHLAGILCAK